jgi:hypothetical protein
VKRRLGLWLLPWLLAPTLWGQVKVFVILDQDQFLPGEAIPIKVRVVNHSGQTLSLGEDNSWLRLSVEADDSFVVSHLEEVPVSGKFLLPPSKMATKDLNLTPYFTLARPGRYSVVAAVSIKEWGETVTSAPRPFDVITGTKLWEQTFGVPGSAGSDGAPEVRKYLLQQANYLRSQIRLYARVTDVSEEQTFGVVPIGPMVSFSRPRALVDRNSNLHVLYQSGPRTSTYCELDPNGLVLAYEQREYSGSRPRLSAGEDGTVRVIGGVPVPVAPDRASPPELKTQTNEPG